MTRRLSSSFMYWSSRGTPILVSSSLACGPICSRKFSLPSRIHSGFCALALDQSQPQAPSISPRSIASVDVERALVAGDDAHRRAGRRPHHVGEVVHGVAGRHAAQHDLLGHRLLERACTFDFS